MGLGGLLRRAQNVACRCVSFRATLGRLACFGTRCTAVMVPLSPPKFMRRNWKPQFPCGYSQVGPTGEIWDQRAPRSWRGHRVLGMHTCFSFSPFDTVYLVREQEGLPMRPPSLCNCEKFLLSKRPGLWYSVTVMKNRPRSPGCSQLLLNTINTKY